MSALDHSELRAACYEVARSIRWDKNPVDSVIASAMVEPFYRAAIHHERFLVEQGYDPNVLTRAVKYLAQKHAIPPMGEDITWFREMLEVLLELACPNRIQNGKNSNGRAHGELRHLGLDEVSPAQLLAVESHLAELREEVQRMAQEQRLPLEGAFKKVQKKVSQLLAAFAGRSGPAESATLPYIPLATSSSRTARQPVSPWPRPPPSSATPRTTRPASTMREKCRAAPACWSGRIPGGGAD